MAFACFSLAFCMVFSWCAVFLLARFEAIFGFCDIRNFTDATEVLQDQVMVFVNRIASVIHSCVNEFFGNPNKNIGALALF